MKSIALAVLLATLAGCAVVPIGPPVYVGARVYGRGYYGPAVYGPYGPHWRRY